MGVTQKRLCSLLVLFIVIIEASGIDINDTSPDENRRSPGRGRVIKQYSGTRPEPILCTGEGFQSDPHNCATFYRCVKSGNDKYTVFRFQCGPGTIYDPDEKVCNHPRNTRRAECGGFLPPIINDTDSNEIQGPMYNEIPSPMDTNKPIDTLQQSTITNAEGTSPSNTKQTTTSPYPWGSATNPSYVDHNAMIMKPINQESNIPHPISRDNICTSDGFMGDSENCRKFYRCVANQSGGYTRYEFTCTETTIWDDYNQICNHIWAVRKTRCSLLNDKITMSNTNNEKPNAWEQNKKPGTENTPNNNVQNQLQIGHGTQVTQTQTQIGHGLVNQNQIQINYGDRLNQNKNDVSKQNQTQISHGSAISQSQTQVNNGNTGVQTQLQIDHSNQASQNQIQIIDSSTNKVSTTVQNSDSQEPDKHDSVECTEAGFIGDSTDCAKFYRCIDNGQGGFKKFGFTCADGTAWDPSLNTCNHIWAVKGCNSQFIGSTTQTLTTVRDKTTQSYYTTTSTEHTTPQRTDNDNENTGYGYPKPESTSTSSISPTSTTISDAKGTECTSNGFMGDNNNCKIFYRCVENSNGGFTKYVFNCGEGTVWDPEIEACNHAWAVEKCGGNASTDINKVDTTTEKLTNSSPVYIQSTVATHSPTESFPDQYEDNDIGYGSSNNDIHTTTSSKPPSIINNGDHICKSSGFIGDEHDCQKFYRCVDNGEGGFIIYEFTCSEGTLWDSEINTCNHASAVNGCNKTPTTKKPKEENENDGNSTENENTTTTTSRSITTTTSKTTSTTESVLIDSAKCTHAGFMGDPNDCKKFFRCVDDGSGSYTKFEFRCGEGTLWDDAIKSCNHAWAVTKCGVSSGSSPVNDEINNDFTSENTTEPSVLITTKVPHVPNESFSETTTISRDENHQQKPTPKPPNSPVICTAEGFYGDKYNCRQFYRCVDNGNGEYNIYYFNCGEGTVWDQELLTCNHESLSNCTSSVTTDSQPQPGSVSTTTDSNTSSVLSSNDCQSEGFFAVPNNCSNFIRCVNNNQGGFTKHEYTCSEGTVWIQEMLNCYNYTGDIDKVSCPGSVMHDEDNTQSTKPTTTTETTKNEVTASQDLTSTTSSASSTKQTSIPNSEHNSNSDLQNTDTCNSEGFYGNTQDCKKFYRCVSDGKGGYTKYDFDCAEGTIWDKDVTTCNHPENVVNPSCNLNQEGNTTEGPGATGSNQESTKKPSNNINCTKAGFYANPNDCKKFYRCVDWDGNQTKFSIYHFECGEGTIWDPAIETCNHEDSVYPPRDCSGSQSQSSTTEGTTTTKNESTTQSISQTTTESTTQSATESTTLSATESTTPSATELTTTSTTESSTISGTESTTLSATESTSMSTTELTPTSTNEVISTSTTDSSTLSATESTSTLTTESTTLSVTESTTSTTESITPSATESTTTSNIESSTLSATESPSTSITESTNPLATESITPSATESTTMSTTESSTLSGTESTTPSVTELTTTSTTESTTLSSTESTTSSVTESTNMPTTESSTLSATESITTSTTESTTPSATESTNTLITDSTTLSATESTTPSFTESTTTSTTKLSTFSPTESTTTSTTESTTFSATESTNTSTTESTTLSATESTTTSPTELSTLSPTESTTTSTTESATPSATESTNMSTTESTTPSITESTSTSTTELSTLSPTKSTTTLTTESTTPSGTESTIALTNESTTLSTTESTTPSVTELTSTSTTESTTTSTTESTTMSTTESSTTSATESTTLSATESITPSVTESTTASTTDSPTLSTTEPTTTSATESATLSATELTTMSTTESTTPSVTESITTSTTESTTPSVTESTAASTTESTTLSATESTTPSATESTTTSITESSTLSATESTTSTTTSTTESTTTSTTESTTLSTTESTTPSVTESTTKSTTESTTSTSGEPTTTERSEEGTTEQSTQSTTEYSTQSTTEHSGQSTTEQLGESTTTERPDGSTTEKIGETTTQKSGESTTETSGGSTTEDSGEKTTTEISSTTAGTTNTSTEKPSAEDCPATEEDQYLYVCPSSFRRHPKYCNIFYQCDENEDTHDIKIATFTCPNNTIYDESQTKCVQESKAQKPCNGEVAQKRRVKRKDRIGNNVNDPIEVTEDSYACTGAGYYAFEKDGDCSPGFLKCMVTKSNKLRGLVYQCPAGYLFWTVSRRCEPIYKINDCRRSVLNNWSRRWEIPVERRNVAW